MIGLFFGSFNPIHLGHTSLAKHLLEHAALEEVWFVLSPQNPLKNTDDLLDDIERLKLVELAIADEAKFKACDVEFSLPKPNYTIRTLERLSEMHPNMKFAIIIGADNLALFHCWSEYERILANYTLIVYPREGTYLAELKAQYPQVQIVEAPLFPISSTEIRQLLQQKKDASEWLHPLVYEYILQNSLFLK